MSRSLAHLPLLTATLLVLLAGCASQAPVDVVAGPSPAQVAPLPVQQWLEWQDSVSKLSAPQLATALETAANTGEPNEIFYFGLLRQQADDYQSWVAARDIFRQLQQDEALTPAQRQLSGILERYNQSRINWFHSRDELRQRYEALQQQNRLLEQKIQAITDLEATMSTRKEE
jgi:hypothetical protein